MVTLPMTIRRTPQANTYTGGVSVLPRPMMRVFSLTPDELELAGEANRSTVTDLSSGQDLTPPVSGELNRRKTNATKLGELISVRETRALKNTGA